MSSNPTRGEAIRDQLREELIALLPELRAFAHFLLREPAGADDLVQETVMRALAALAQFQAGTSLRAWTFTILRNFYHEQARRRRTERRVIEEGALAEPESPPAQHGKAELDDLERFLWDLPPLLREALVLVGARGLGYEEAAVVCGVPIGTMKARVSRARTRLARVMGRNLGASA